MLEFSTDKLGLIMFKDLKSRGLSSADSLRSSDVSKPDGEPGENSVARVCSVTMVPSSFC
jgi:hypothetical protein